MLKYTFYKRKLFDDEEKNLGPEVKVRVIDCTQQQDYHFIGKGKEGNQPLATTKLI